MPERPPAGGPDPEEPVVSEEPPEGEGGVDDPMFDESVERTDLGDLEEYENPEGLEDEDDEADDDEPTDEDDPTYDEDLSLPRFDPSGWGRRGLAFRDTVVALFNGGGAMGLSYDWINEQEWTDQAPAETFVMRLAVGTVATALSFGISWKARQWSESGTAWSHIRGGAHRKAITLVGITGGLMATAVLSGLKYGFRVADDYKANHAFQLNIEDYITLRQGFLDDPSALPFLLEFRAEQHADTLAHLTPEGTWTSEALLRLALYSDGDSISEAGCFQTGEEREKESVYYEKGVWCLHHEPSDQRWLVSANPKKIKKPQNIPDFIQSHAPTPEAATALQERLKASGLIDGQTAVDQAVAELDVSTLQGQEPAHLDRLNSFFPYEWNRYWREQVRQSLGPSLEDEIAPLEQDFQAVKADITRQYNNALTVTSP